MSFRIRISPRALPLSVLSLALASGCQKKDDHPPFEQGCESNCPQLPGISVGNGSSGSGSGGASTSDAGPTSLTGQVLLLNDDTFVKTALFNRAATVSADGFSGSPVTADWNGADDYVLQGVSRLPTNWVSVKPEQLGVDALETYQAVSTASVTQVNLATVSSTVLDGIFNSLASLRSPSFGQVILFFRSQGTGTALSGLHVAMPASALAAYHTATGWIVDDGTAVTDQTGLVLFGNVDAANASGTQTVTVERAATATTPAVSGGQFAVRSVVGAVTIATVNVQF